MIASPGLVNTTIWAAARLVRAVSTAPPAPSPFTSSSSSPSTATPGAAIELPALLYSTLLGGAVLIALIVLFMPDRTREQRGRIHVLGVAGAGIALFFAVWAVQTQANQAEVGTGGRPGAELSENHGWIVSFAVRSSYHLDADGVALALLLVSTVIFFCASMAAFRNDRRVRLFTVCLLLLETGVNGVLLSQDWLLFLLFWALPIIPLHLLIRGWSPPEAARVVNRHAIIALLSTVLITSGALILTFQSGTHSFDITRTPAGIAGPAAGACFWLFFTGFLLASAAVPLHLPHLDLSEEGTSPIAVVIAALLPMLGLFGLMRVVVPILPTQLSQYSVVLAALGVVAALWGAASALAGDNLRRIVSSIGIAQLGAVLVAISVSNSVALTGATLLLVSRGFVVALLMFLAGCIEERTRHVSLDLIGGLAWQAPRLAGMWIFSGLTAVGVPLLSGFAGTLLLFTGAYQGHRFSTVLVIAGIVLTGLAILSIAQRLFFGPSREVFSRVKDLTTLELTYMGVLVTFIVLFGIFPNRFLGLIGAGASSLLPGHGGSG